MNVEKVPFALNSLLYFLNYIYDVSEYPVLPDNLIDQIKNKYEKELVDGMCEALTWSKSNSDFDFSSQIPLRYENTEIVNYLDNVRRQFIEEGILKER